MELGAAIPTLLHEARRASLLVLGARGIGGFERMLIGSVSTAVAERAGCPSSSSGHRHREVRLPATPAESWWVSTAHPAPWRERYPDVTVTTFRMLGHPVTVLGYAAAGCPLLVVGTPGAR